MNLENNQNTSGSAVTMAQHVANELRKSGTKAWAGLPSPEEMEQLRVEKAERDFEQSKRRADAYDRKLADLKERIRQRFQWGNHHE